MLVSRDSGAIDHRGFRDLPKYLRAGDVMVFNDSRVMPARLHGTRSTGGKVELLLLNRLSPGRWRALVRPGRRMQPGVEFQVPDRNGRPTMTGEILEVEADGTRVLRLSNEGRIGDVGSVPLPPYHPPPLSARSPRTFCATHLDDFARLRLRSLEIAWKAQTGR